MMEARLVRGKRSTMRLKKLLGNGKSKWIRIAAGILVLSIVFLNCYVSNSKKYIIDDVWVDENIVYPKVRYVNSKNNSKADHINKLIADNLYGPYDFLGNDDVGVDLNYEIIFMNEEYLSICYKGVYVIEGAICNSFCYGVNIDLDQECLIPIQQRLDKTDMERLYNKLKQKDFITEYGAVTPDGAYIDINDVLPSQPVFYSELGFYNYFFDRENLFVIITGLSRYAGNYSILKISDIGDRI